MTFEVILSYVPGYAPLVNNLRRAPQWESAQRRGRAAVVMPICLRRLHSTGMRTDIAAHLFLNALHTG